MSGETQAAWFAALVALFSLIYSMYQLRKQIQIQNDFQRRRLEEDYLRNVLYVIKDGLKAAQTFVSKWEWNNHPLGRKYEEHTFLEKVDEARRTYEDEWRMFDRHIEAAIILVRAAEGEGELVERLRLVHAKSNKLFDVLMEKSDRFKSEAELMASDLAKDLEKEAELASASISERLAKLYRG